MSLIRNVLDLPCSSRFAATFSSRLPSLAPPVRRRFSTSPSLRQIKAAQPDTPATDNIELSAPVAYISESHDPWFNLSYEDWLMRNTPVDQPVLFVYRNSPCVVIGRNQNPWKETTPRLLRSASVPLVRRRSGGGTVYHDLGNTNFSIILPRVLFTRSHGAELVARAVRERMGVRGCGVNERNDVIVTHEGRDLKVSGSAYKIIQHRAYHHGTMLISSSLSELGKNLKTASPNIQTKGIPSHPSPVTTLNSHLPSTRLGKPFTHHDFVRAITSEFSAVYDNTKSKRMETREVVESHVREANVWEGVREMKSWEWAIGQTPEFTNEIEGEIEVGRVSGSLSSRHALITSMSLHLDPSPTLPRQDAIAAQALLDALALALVGRRYETLDGAEGAGGPWVDDAKSKALVGDVVAWLRRAM